MALRDGAAAEPVGMVPGDGVAAEPVGKFPVFPVPVADGYVFVPAPVGYVCGPVAGVVCAYATGTTAISAAAKMIDRIFGSSLIKAWVIGLRLRGFHPQWVALVAFRWRHS